MFLFVGLGNPGKKYEGTRHNVGREILVLAVKKFFLPEPAPIAKLPALAAKGTIGSKEAAFLLPETFVNKSGSAVLPAMKFFKAKPGGLVVVHDDVDLLLGAAKLSFGKNSGGHKGVESVMRALKTKNFWRMRIGVQKKRRVPGEDLVLQKFRGDEVETIKRVMKKSVGAIEAIAAEGPERAMNGYNG